VQDLSWDTFPEPPPEAATWKPDPAYIASPGQLKDPRFNKDPYEAARLKAARKEYGYQIRHSSEAVGMSSASAPSSSTLEPANAEHGRQRGRTTHVPAKESVENFEVKPPESYPLMTPPKHAAPSKSKPPAKTSLPAWAGPLEKALAEDTSKGSVLPTQTEVKSVPPHLRKICKVISMSAPSDRRRELHPVTTKHQPALLDLTASSKAACEATRQVLGSKIYAPSTVDDADLLRREASTAKMTTPSNGLKDVGDVSIYRPLFC
jgi:hypothetical protein